MGAILARSVVHHVPEARLVAVADVHLASARRLADDLGVRAAYPSAAELVEVPDVDGVIVAVSSARHLEVIRDAAAAGRDIFCEKPLALTIADCEAAVEAASMAGVRLQVGFMRRFDPAYRRASRRLAKGDVGRPILFKSLQFDPGAPPPAVADPAISGGIHIDMGIHEYDLARWLMADEVVEVHAWGSSLAYPELTSVGDVDSAVVNLRFAGGGTGSVQLARSALVEDVRTEIVGERGTIAIGRRPALRPGPADDGASSATAGWGTGPLRFDRAYVEEMRAFARSIADGAPVEVGGAEGIASLRIALAAAQSMQDGRPVTVDDR
jgi:predicted dehydrogenase